MRLFTAIAIVFTLGLGTTAQAAGGTATLVAGPLLPGGPGQYLICGFVNVSTGPVTVVIEALESDGNLANVREFVRSPGRTGRLTTYTDDLFGLSWCRFTVQGKASTIRATATVFDNAGHGSISAVSAH